MAEVDHKRFDNEMNDLKTKGWFVNKDGQNSKEIYLKEQKKLNQVQPKKPITAYVIYMAEKVKEIK